MIAGPSFIRTRLAFAAKPPNDVAVGIKDAHSRNGHVGKLLLTTRFPN
jgi:hypothetical protein